MQDGPKPLSPVVDDEDNALAEFLDAYRLVPGQNLKRIPPPRPKGIRVWYGRHKPALGHVGDLNLARALAFDWRDPDQLHASSSLFGRSEGLTIRELPLWLKMGFYSHEIEGDPELLKTQVGGDWIVREGVPADQLVRPLEAILQRAVRKRMTMAVRQVERDVLVARGRYRPSPLPGHTDGKIEIYARELARDDERGEGVAIFPSFLEWMAGLIGRPIVNEVEAPPNATVAWHYNHREASAERNRREGRYVTLLLKHLEEQTGLTFTREKRPVRVLFVERPAEVK
jgi:hypothetical protein